MVYVAVLANIAGNFPALAAALGRMEELKEEGYDIEKYYILGNIVGLFPYPKETVEAIKNLAKGEKVKVIRGKYDQLIAMSDPHAEGPEYIDRLNIPPYLKEALKFTWEKLGHEGREFLRDLPVYLVDRIGNNEIFGVYGSPISPFEGEVLPDQPTSYYEAIMRPVKDYEMLIVASPRYPLDAMTRYGRVVCPGSIGFPPAKEHKATFALIDVETLRVKFFEVNYDKKLIEDRIRNEKLPEDIVKILYHGKA
ncbi:metallophosphatase family protein [Pyrococcus yayanosii]|uniref:Metallophosphoesterase n=1 Tax=Pyrococcus yayanosii (strain CH1 / JCM 16557) TaxID=529709 RepID=F8AEA1_PYRYC|nr:metallophosphatase family protein [Pyrococcus yayanosii]AEH24612.1 hypothetical protein PYCH_09270 [Pyrococcus yayanosii CH1]